MVKHTKEKLEEAVKTSITWAQVCRKLGVKPATGAQSHLKKRASEYDVDSSHFLGQGWSRGQKFPAKNALESYLRLGVQTKSSYLRERLIAEGLKGAFCEQCLLTTWEGEPAPLELDHVNGDHSDNRLANLQILCPNCHAQKTKSCPSSPTGRRR